MVQKYLVGAGLLFVAVYACTPRDDDKEEAETKASPASEQVTDWRSNSNSSSSSASKQNARKSSGWGGSDTTLRRELDGHFYADAFVNGREINFLIDTGASGVALTRSDAEALGLTWDEDRIHRVGTGANGAVYGVFVTLDEVDLGGYKAHSVSAVIIPKGLKVSLLGQSFLKTIDNVSINGDEMVLGE